MDQRFDIIIIGGGVNGCGIARDCAMRGLSVLLVEKGDFSEGTSGASSGMIHGGARYLFSNVQTTRLSCLDSGYIQKIAPHLLFRIPFVYPVYQDSDSFIKRMMTKLRLELAEAFFEGYDRFVSLKNGRDHTRLSSQEVLKLEPGINPKDLLGAITFDEWGIDVPRLCVANALSAAKYGALVRNHCQVIEVIKEANQVTGVRIQNLLNGEMKNIHSSLVLNATGPWSPQFGKMAGVNIRLRPGKGIHLIFDRRLSNVAINCRAIDGREIFVMPYENVSILGTTDDDYFGDLDDQRVMEDEVQYLLEAVEPVFPSIRSARIICSWSGVRPTLYSRHCYEDNLSREYEIIDHEGIDQVKGLVSIIGGKLASYRIMSEEVTDLVCKKLQVTNPCRTHTEPLPGGDSIPDVGELAREFGMEPYAVSRLVYRYGSVARDILAKTQEDSSLKSMVCTCEPVTKVEVQNAIQNEWACTLSDVRRRTRLSLGPCQATNCLLSGMNVLFDERKLPRNDFDKAVQTFMQEWWWNRAVILSGQQLAQEELYQAVHFGVNCFDR